MGTKRLRRQRVKLFHKQDGKCHWCAAQMVLVKVINPKDLDKTPRLCTLDHVDSRWSPERGKHNGERRHVAACIECNKRRNDEDHAAAPRELLWARSGSYPLSYEEVVEARQMYLATG